MIGALRLVVAWLLEWGGRLLMLLGILGLLIGGLWYGKRWILPDVSGPPWTFVLLDRLVPFGVAPLTIGWCLRSASDAMRREAMRVRGPHS